ncbi:MAG: hypothetical protein RLZZ416_806 [Candidatus Parcubacteria bacterium]
MTERGATLERVDFQRLVAGPALRRFVSKSPSNRLYWWVRTTSGTTAREPIVVISPIRNTDEWGAGVRRRVLCTGLLSVRLHNVMLAKHLGLSRTLALDIEDMDGQLGTILRDFDPDAFHGTPSFIMRVADFAPKVRTSVTGLYCTGETLSTALRDQMLARFPAASLRAVYKCNEIGFLTKPSCGRLPLNSYHFRKDVRFEVADPDERGIGELLVSSSSPELRVLRYRLGDSGRLMKAWCRCGEIGHVEIVGRTGHDYIKLNGAILRREEFDRIARRCRALFDDYRVIARIVLRGDRRFGLITLCVFRKGGVSPRNLQRIKDIFTRELFLAKTLTLEDVVRRGLLLPLLVEAAETPFPKARKDIKLRYVE